MEKATGRTSKGLHDLPNGAIISMDDFIFNCHVCKKIYSPVKIKLKATDKRFYFQGVWSRIFIILEVEDKVCMCREDNNTIVLYDNIDPIIKSFGKEAV